MDSYSDFLNLSEFKNLSIDNDSKLKINIKQPQKIIILGPHKRNLKIFNFLKKDGNEVIIYTGE